MSNKVVTSQNQKAWPHGLSTTYTNTIIHLSPQRSIALCHSTLQNYSNIKYRSRRWNVGEGKTRTHII